MLRIVSIVLLDFSDLFLPVIMSFIVKHCYFPIIFTAVIKAINCITMKIHSCDTCVFNLPWSKLLDWITSLDASQSSFSKTMGGKILHAYS